MSKVHYSQRVRWGPACGAPVPQNVYGDFSLLNVLAPSHKDEFLKLSKEEQCQTCLRICFAKPKSMSELVDQAEHFQATLDSKTALRRVIAMLREARAAKTGELAIEEELKRSYETLAKRYDKPLDREVSDE